MIRFPAAERRTTSKLYLPQNSRFEQFSKSLVIGRCGVLASDIRGIWKLSPLDDGYRMDCRTAMSIT